ncbi:dihydroneopterin aldolase [Streptomyces sp. HU2014]|uniref:7,8-dihydroneopterin aldolase n=1 Tax=Streptomyces albireticuli TaxID=1940 RepID=A0A1Z2KUQ6_9ACTN|nr:MULTISPECIES: dihydroneopterin aldolase [Streptomyces]ARZ65750.1 dihydroneopterin triphosphate 2'-epimerase [sulfur-oxidizing symbionts] [Streptomyces albireticuli]UQI46053.1 dihydroneopterin aldolase [Streptomyces sp. HU2014]
MTSTDTVFIRGLEIPALIGVDAWERQVRQIVVINLELTTDITPAAARDDLRDALDYSAVVRRLKEFVGASTFQLVETLAERTARTVLDEFPVRRLRLELVKPRPNSGGHTVGIIIERGAPAE